MFCRIDSVRLGEHTFNSSKDCEVDIEQNRTICSDPHVDIKVQAITFHPKFRFDQNQLMHDIALIRLNKTVNYTG